MEAREGGGSKGGRWTQGREVGLAGVGRSGGGKHKQLQLNNNKITLKKQDTCKEGLLVV